MAYNNKIKVFTIQEYHKGEHISGGRIIAHIYDEQIVNKIKDFLNGR